MSLVVLVTGAARGLGLEFVRQLSEAGYVVVAAVRSPEGSAELQKLANNKKIHTLYFDIVETESVEAAMEQARKIAPGGIDILINTTWIFDPRSVNVGTSMSGAVETTMAFRELLHKANTRKVINVSSSLGCTAPFKNTGDNSKGYCATKAGENLLTSFLASTLQVDEFTVITINPGWVQNAMGTEITPLKPAESVSCMLKVISNVTVEDSGAFFDYTGDKLLW
ncbi:hypothetical protein EC973_000563 [Apophysomyces ossiformis]|uniref:Uncharacterized protein n=1 Tax=Apophysomyces ossiformis TaxID=679940 RepID=A0A8H7BN77_9FUNG|nr:hypothetical protein EC973_000563 [Apophysomyces ossiformis]